MAKNKSNKFLIIILAIVVVALFIQPGGISKTGENLQGVVDKVSSSFGGTGGAGPSGTATNPDDFISFKFYDANHNEVKLKNDMYAIVSGTPGIKYAQASITVKNTGSYALSCIPTNVTPTAWGNALTKTEKQILIGGKAGWTSGDIDLDTLATTSGPVRFTAAARCTYNNGATVVTLGEKSGYVDVTIQPDSTNASFDVTVLMGGAPTEYCGDLVCQVTETASTCPADCAVANNVKFRTTDLAYVSGSAIGFSATCGNTLTAYGYYSGTGTLGGTCAATMPTATWCGTAPTLVATLPGSYLTGGVAPTLWKPSEATTICVCDDTGSNYLIKKYTTADSDASKVDTSKTSFDTSKEVAC